MSKAQFSGNKSNSAIDSDEWYTPLNLISRVQKFYDGMYWCDVCSTKDLNESIKASAYITKDQNALSESITWHHQGIWMNPPYSRNLISKFVNRFLQEYTKSGLIEHGIILVNSSTETGWFYDLAITANVRIDIRSRLKFWHPSKQNKSPISGSTLFYFGYNPYGFLELFGDLGLCYASSINKGNK